MHGHPKIEETESPFPSTFSSSSCTQCSRLKIELETLRKHSQKVERGLVQDLVKERVDKGRLQSELDDLRAELAQIHSQRGFRNGNVKIKREPEPDPFIIISDDDDDEEEDLNIRNRSEDTIVNPSPRNIHSKRNVAEVEDDDIIEIVAPVSTSVRRDFVPSRKRQRLGGSQTINDTRTTLRRSSSSSIASLPPPLQPAARPVPQQRLSGSAGTGLLFGDSTNPKLRPREVESPTHIDQHKASSSSSHIDEASKSNMSRPPSSVSPLSLRDAYLYSSFSHLLSTHHASPSSSTPPAVSSAVSNHYEPASVSIPNPSPSSPSSSSGYPSSSTSILSSSSCPPPSAPPTVSSITIGSTPSTTAYLPTSSLSSSSGYPLSAYSIPSSSSCLPPPIPTTISISSISTGFTPSMTDTTMAEVPPQNNPEQNVTIGEESTREVFPAAKNGLPSQPSTMEGRNDQVSTDAQAATSSSKSREGSGQSTERLSSSDANDKNCNPSGPSNVVKEDNGTECKSCGAKDMKKSAKSKVDAKPFASQPPEMDIQPLWKETVTSLLRDIPRFEIDPPVNMDFRVKRQFLNHVYDINTGSFMAIMRPQHNPDPPDHSRSRPMLFPFFEENPTLPAKPGDPGMMLTAREDILKVGPVSIFLNYNRRVSPSVWLYAGQYELESCAVVTGEQFSSLPKKTQFKWADTLISLKKDPWGSMRARIRLRKRNLPLTDENVADEIESIARAKKKNSSPPKPDPVELQDCIDAFVKEEERINIIRMKCIGYDRGFLEDMEAKLKLWEENPRKSVFINKDKPEMKSKKSNKREMKEAKGDTKGKGKAVSSDGKGAAEETSSLSLSCSSSGCVDRAAPAESSSSSSASASVSAPVGLRRSARIERLLRVAESSDSDSDSSLSLSEGSEFEGDG